MYGPSFVGRELYAFETFFVRRRNGTGQIRRKQRKRTSTVHFDDEYCKKKKTLNTLRIFRTNFLSPVFNMFRRAFRYGQKWIFLVDTRPRILRGVSVVPAGRDEIRKYASPAPPTPLRLTCVVLSRSASATAVHEHVASPPRTRCVSVHSSARDHAVLFLRAGRGLARAGGVHRAPGRPAAKRHVAERRRPRAPRHRHAVQRVLGHTDREQRVPVRHGRLHVRGRQPGAQRRVHCPSERQRYRSASTLPPPPPPPPPPPLPPTPRPGAVDPRRAMSGTATESKRRA